ncbi:hypothetical protein BGW36DRAFT_435895 [Talaromyces proteolyticus]|uniref:BTB domain-containing protein n=1 Tax=Talaromyces proteolyticus TaxID=1131652 RepID=A0AAD4Q1P0_9EURO|nr:uncharacterized protein BGW36DRAFT_435895 [Talaromyces proteolyticus]KAH8705850.1 hypothetical protein BGW36DRAFT_435895 [Talaromyces proteolyticus]
MAFSSTSRNMMSDILAKEECTDLEIVCQDQTFKAHRVIVCSQSPFFGVAVVERSQNVIKFGGPPSAIKRVLSYLYTGDYDLDEQTPIGSDYNETASIAQLDQPIQMSETIEYPPVNTKGNGTCKHFRVYHAAHLLGIESLTNISRGRFIGWMAENWACMTFAYALFDALRHMLLGDSRIHDDLVGDSGSRDRYPCSEQGLPGCPQNIQRFSVPSDDEILSYKDRVDMKLMIVKEEIEKLVESMEGGKFRRSLSAMSRCQSRAASFIIPLRMQSVLDAGSRIDSFLRHMLRS